MNVNGTINTGTATETDLVTGTPAQAVQKRGRRWRLIVLGVVVVFAGALTSGAWNHLTQYRLTAAARTLELPRTSVRHLLHRYGLPNLPASGRRGR